jgi:hypothetical protein
MQKFFDQDSERKFRKLSKKQNLEIIKNLKIEILKFVVKNYQQKKLQLDTNEKTEKRLILKMI